jgi:MFS family permease
VRIARRLAVARLVSLSGGSAAYIALVAALYGETGSALWISAAIFASVVSSVVSAPFAGWIGDRFDRRRVLIGTDVAASFVGFAMAAAARHPLALVVLLGALSAVQAPFEPASAAALPSVVSAADVPRANSLIAATSSAGYLVGPLLGGAVLAVGASPAALFVVDAATFLFSAAVVVSMRRSFGRGSTEEHPGVLAGVRVIARERALRIPVLAGMVSLLGVGIVDVASYPLSLDLGGGSAGYGAMTGLLGGGGVLGAAVAGRLLHLPAARVLAGAFAASAAGLALAGAAPVLALVLAGMAVAGAGRGLGDVAEVTPSRPARPTRCAAVSSPRRTEPPTSRSRCRPSPVDCSSRRRAPAVPSASSAAFRVAAALLAWSAVRAG